jgi:hypothetical protein
MLEGSGSVQIMTDLDPGGPKPYGSGSTTLLSYLVPDDVFPFSLKCSSSHRPIKYGF